MAWHCKRPLAIDSKRYHETQTLSKSKTSFVLWYSLEKSVSYQFPQHIFVFKYMVAMVLNWWNFGVEEGSFWEPHIHYENVTILMGNAVARRLSNFTPN